MTWMIKYIDKYIPNQKNYLPSFLKELLLLLTISPRVTISCLRSVWLDRMFGSDTKVWSCMYALSWISFTLQFVIKLPRAERVAVFTSLINNWMHCKIDFVYLIYILEISSIFFRQGYRCMHISLHLMSLDNI